MLYSEQPWAMALQGKGFICWLNGHLSHVWAASQGNGGSMQPDLLFKREREFRKDTTSNRRAGPRPCSR